MPQISVKDIFKVGIGPSSSHTLGPWRIALSFLKEMEEQQCLEKAINLKILLWNSLAKTGLGHATDLGVLLGLEGEDYETMGLESIETKIKAIKENNQIRLYGKYLMPFSIKHDLIFNEQLDLEKHPNQIDFILTIEGQVEARVIKQSYASVGGGFIERISPLLEGKEVGKKENPSKNFSSGSKHQFSTFPSPFPYPIEKAKQIVDYCESNDLNMYQVVKANELSYQSQLELKNFIEKIAEVMIDSVYVGCHTEGILPGGLNVTRRAFKLNQQLFLGKVYSNKEEWIDILRQQKPDFKKTTQFISCFALAVNEVNASMGRVVTAPTNGAAGVIPAVFMYYLLFVNPDITYKDKETFFLIASEIGSLFKKNASISAASGGCQAEIGVSSSMAAAALTYVQCQDTQKTLMASEIAMEHHLGLTCDPIGGLVQIPCIERNTMGAMKAITASEIALNSAPEAAIVKLDDVIKTMWETAKDMDVKYKETSTGGLAINIPINIIEC